MKSQSNFWLVLHQLANELEREGETNEARIQTIIDVLNHVSPATRTVYQENSLHVLRMLNALAMHFEKDNGTDGPADESLPAN